MKAAQFGNMSHSGAPNATEVTFLLFPREVFLMQEVQNSTYDPKQLMDTLLEVKEGIIK